MSLYNIKRDNAAKDYGKEQFIINKFDEDLNHESTYLVSKTGCTCPAGVRPSCRHRNMLPRMMQHIGDGWFHVYETNKWIRPLNEPEPEQFIEEALEGALLIPAEPHPREQAQSLDSAIESGAIKFVPEPAPEVVAAPTAAKPLVTRR